jgi:hypothetical protein
MVAGQESAPTSRPADIALSHAERQYEFARKHYLEAVEQRENLWAMIRGQSGLVDATPHAIHQLAQRLQEQRETLEVERAGDGGRRIGIEQAIDRVSIEMQKKVASDEISAELQKVVDARQKTLDRYRNVPKGTASEADLLSAERELAASRAELAAARQRATAATIEAIDAWNRELLNLNVAQEERQQKLKFINERLEKLAPALTESDQLERKSEQVAAAERQMDAAYNSLRIMQTNAQK